jgi:GTPase SAR1 family protein
MGEPAASSSPGAAGDPSGSAHNASAAVATAPSALPSSAVQFQSSPGVATARSLKPQVVRIEVLGDDKVGKTSLICSLVSRHFSERVPAVLLNVQIPAEENNENVIISITDTSCTCSCWADPSSSSPDPCSCSLFLFPTARVSDLVRVANATKRSDAILLVYDLTRPETIQRLRRWLDLIARHKEVPVVLVGNKDDIKTVVTSSTIMDGLHSNQIRQLTTTYQVSQAFSKRLPTDGL